MATDDGTVFVDHYAMLGASPDLPGEELKRLYFDKIREFHPDKRPESAGSTGQRMTQCLNEAWEILRDPQRKEAYDQSWRREKERAMLPHERADLHRRRGNDIYSRAREISKDSGSVMNLASVHQSMQLYKRAMEEYSQAMQDAPNDHRLYSNRALCYLAVEDWGKARDDAQQCARLRPDFKKAWLLLTKALWKMGRVEEATVELQQGLRFLPGCAELMELQADFSREIGESSFKSRSVSPVFTPVASRNGTPTRNQTYSPGPGNRPSSPSLASAAQNIIGQGRSPGHATTYGGHSSRSPGPARNRGGAVPLDHSGTFQTGNFGAPTPSFQNPPSHQAMNQSFPASVHSMWGAGNANQRQNYSPGPGGGGVYYSAGPDLNSSSGREQSQGRSTSQGRYAKSHSLKGMLETSRGPTPPPRSGNTPPRR